MASVHNETMNNQPLHAHAGEQSEHPLDPALLRPKRGWRAWLFARAMSQVDSLHDTLIAGYKQRLLADLRGNVLEIGPGAGANFDYFDAGVRWVGVEPNPHMHPYLHASAAQHGRDIELHTGYTEALPVADASMDAVVSTLVLCSVIDLDASLAEIQRVLKPGGKYIFIEHVAAPVGSALRRVQNGVRPLWSFLGDGCHPNREIWRYIEGAGFSHVEIEHFSVNIPIAKPHIAGWAIK
jgi:ubiquinone/menaquinone biosynthesis C-methylase UbiE